MRHAELKKNLEGKNPYISARELVYVQTKTQIAIKIILILVSGFILNLTISFPSIIIGTLVNEPKPDIFYTFIFGGIMVFTQLFIYVFIASIITTKNYFELIWLKGKEWFGT